MVCGYGCDGEISVRTEGVVDEVDSLADSCRMYVCILCTYVDGYIKMKLTRKATHGDDFFLPPLLVGGGGNGEKLTLCLATFQNLVHNVAIERR